VFKCDRKANTDFEEEGSKETINAKGELEEAANIMHTLHHKALSR